MSGQWDNDGGLTLKNLTALGTVSAQVISPLTGIVFPSATVSGILTIGTASATLVTTSSLTTPTGLISTASGTLASFGTITGSAITAAGTMTAATASATIITLGGTALTPTGTQINNVGTFGTTRLPITSGKNAAGTAIVATSPAGTDFVVVSTPGTVINLVGHAAQNNTKSDTAEWEVVLPQSYVAAGNITLTIQSSYALAAGTTLTATVDASAYLMATDGTMGADIVATAAQAITASKADYAFTITGTTLTPGARVLLTVTTSVTEGGDAGTITAKVWSLRLS